MNEIKNCKGISIYTQGIILPADAVFTNCIVHINENFEAEMAYYRSSWLQRLFTKKPKPSFVKQT